jgi:hypothetical protein
MTSNEYRTMIRRMFEELPLNVQDFCALRAIKREVFAWDLLTGEQLDSLYGSCRTTSMMFVERTEGEGLWPHT